MKFEANLGFLPLSCRERGYIFLWIEWNFMQTPVLKGCEKEVMCSLSNAYPIECKQHYPDLMKLGLANFLSEV